MTAGVERFSLKGRTVVVTGASSGLGVAMAAGAAATGANVVIAARRKELLEKVAADIAVPGSEILAVQADVTSEEDVQRLLDDTLGRFGQVDVLVNNAGTTNIAAAENETAAEFQRILNVNLVSTFVCSQAFGRVMLEAGSGSIVNLSSILGSVASGQIPQAGYVASKGGVTQLTKELATQWARRGVRVNAIAPGWFESEMTGEMFGSEAGQGYIRKRTPMGRGGQPDELVGAMLFLASDASSFVTGQVLHVDGGWTII
jgi:NAD(P)-dependent dehydrogenase (short-subunit alcohol dehydrogenase family)